MSFYARPLARLGSIVPREPYLRKTVEAGGFQSVAAKASRKRIFCTTNIPTSQQRPIPSQPDITRLPKPSGYYYNPTQPLPSPSPGGGAANLKRRPPFLLMTLGTMLGFLGALTTVAFLSLPLPAPGSKSDAIILAQITHRGDELVDIMLDQIVQRDGSAELWGQIDSLDPPHIDQHKPALLAGPLSSSSALPFHFFIMNKCTGELLGVVFVGNGSAGWPSLVHGGATATLLQTAMESAASLGRVPAPTAEDSEPHPVYFDRPDVDSFQINYRSKLATGRFYYIIARQEEDVLDPNGQRSRIIKAAITRKTPFVAVENDIMVEAAGRYLIYESPNRLPADTVRLGDLEASKR